MDVQPPTVIKPGTSQEDVPQNSTLQQAPPSVPPSAPNPSSVKPKPSKKQLIIFGAASALVVLGTVAYTFAYYLPNKPQNVWKTSLSKTAEGYTKLIDYAEKAQKDKIFTKTELDGNFKFAMDGMSFDGTMSGVADDKNGNLNLSLGAAGHRVTADLIMADSQNSEYPDMYVKLGGIKGLSERFIGDNRLDVLNDQWVGIDHSMLDTIVAQAAQSDASGAVTTPKAEDVIAAARVVGQQTKDYLLGTDSSKAVLVMDKFVAKETVDSKSANHYKAKLNKEHLKTYVASLGTELDKTELGKWYKGVSNGKTFSEDINSEELRKELDKIKDDQTFDLWVNNSTKLIQKVKFEDATNAANKYIEAGLNYDGGDEFPFFANIKDFTGTDSTEHMIGKIALSINTKTNNASMSLSLEGEKKETQNVVINYNFKPSTKDINASAPANSITLAEAMASSGLQDIISMMSNPSPYTDQSQEDIFSQSM